jgi:hypothetical protein
MSLGWDTLSAIVREALGNLDICDRELLGIRANERSITHKLGEYVRDHLEKATGQKRIAESPLSVDCEYNRFGVVAGNPKRLPWEYEKQLDSGELYYTPNPDVIIHHRGNQETNELVIEAKAEFNDLPAAVLLDRMKVVGYVGPSVYYAFGLYLDLQLKDGSLSLHEAILADRKSIEGRPFDGREIMWIKGRRLLVNEGSKKQRPGLKEPTAQINAEARELIPSFDQTYGLKDVTAELRWK